MVDNDILLINKTMAGDPASFRLLVEKYQDYVFSVAMKVLKNREEAEEAAQDAFVKAYRGLASFEQRSKFATWLYQIAWRTSLDRCRSRPAARQAALDDDQRLLQLPDHDNSPARQLQQSDTRRIVQSALDAMKPEDAALMGLYYLQEQSVKEISEITGLTESNVKIKLFRLRDAMKTHLTRRFKQELNTWP